MHGMQVIPHLFAPVGTSNPASRMIAINSGERLIYDFRLPDDHPCGLYWYHPHHHGSATVQVGGGMAGLILVRGPIDQVPEIAAARDELLAIQNPKVNPLGDGKWGWEPVAYKPAAEGGYSFSTAVEFITVNGEPVVVIDRRGKKPATIDGKLRTFRMKPGEVMRLRILNGTDGIPMQLVLPGFEVFVIGQDGVNLSSRKRAAEDAKTAIRMATGNRIELLIRAPRGPASASTERVAPDGVVTRAAKRGDGRDDGDAGNRARFRRRGHAAQDGNSRDSAGAAPRISDLITDSEIVARRLSNHHADRQQAHPDWNQSLIDGRLYRETRSTPR